MQTVKYYSLTPAATMALSLPAEAVILNIIDECGKVFAWVQVDTEKSEKPKSIIRIATGDPLPLVSVRYISTVKTITGDWHYFEVI